MLRRFVLVNFALAIACSSSGKAPLDANIGGAKAFTLTFSSSGDGWLSAAGTVCRAGRCTATVASGTAVAISAAADGGARFDGFTGDCSGATCALTMDADHSVDGSFSHSPPPPGKARLTVRVEGSGSATSTPLGIDCGATCSALFDTGTLVSLRSSAAVGWHFIGWGHGCSGTGACAFLIGNDTDVDARFEAGPPPPDKVQVTVVVGGSGVVRSAPAGIDCPGACQASFAQGTTVSLTAEPAASASFKEWSGACAGSSSRCDLTVSTAVQAGATFVSSPPDECAGLRPVDPGAAPQRYSTSFEHGGLCMPAQSDGAGTLTVVAHASYAGHTDFVSPKGALLSTGSSSGYQAFVGLLSGFERVNVTSSYSRLEAFDSAGHQTAQTPTQHGYRFVTANPLEGVVSSFADLDLNRDRLEGYDDHLALRWSVTVPGDRYSLYSQGVDRKGQTLVIFAGDPIFGAGSIAAEWIDPAGLVSAPFVWSGPRSIFLEPRVGSGFFIRDGTGFVAQIDSGATTTAPAPGWLRTIDPRSPFHMVHGGRGYAVLPPPGSSPTCTQVVEVRAPSGVSCGSASFALGTGACETKEITVGYDGTVVQQFPDAAEQQRADGQATCTWQWWPGFFR